MKWYMVSFFFLVSLCFSSANPYAVTSPDGSITVRVKLTDRIYYNVEVDGNEVMWFSPLSMTTNKGRLGDKPKLVSEKTISINEVIETVWGNRSQVVDSYNQLELNFEGGYKVFFRIYNDGLAYRFETDFTGELLVIDEEIEYRFWQNHAMINHVVDSYTTSYETTYTRQHISDIGTDNLVSLPSVIDQGSIKLAIVESDVFEYPGFYLTKKGNHGRYYVDGSLPKYPTRWEPGGHGLFNLVVQERADFIAKTKG